MVPADVDLGDPAAADPALVGAKAAALAVASGLGLPVLPGFVLTTGFDGAMSDRILDRWASLSDGGRRPLVVRSSSTVEDDLESSMAGRFTSIVGVLGWEAFVAAVGAVLASAAIAPGEPMAVLVQPLLDAKCGGVMFGLDPVTGDRRRIVVEAVEGGPDRLVSGVATATRYVLSRRGRSAERRAALPDLLGLGARVRLARLARATADAFGGPQDVEWAFDRSGRLWLFQSRPVTAVGEAAGARGPILGPGPVGETVPDPLRRLERELFLEPLCAGVRAALGVIGTEPRRRLERSPVIVAVGGRAAADLELLGALPRRRSPWRLLNPVPPTRRLAAAWRVGRLRRVLPARCRLLVDDVDAQLAGVPPLDRLSPTELRTLLSRIRRELLAVHAHEVLAGMLLGAGSSPTLESVAIARLAAGRARGWPDAEIVRRSPVVLALVPPRIADAVHLPPAVPATAPGDVRDLGSRDALRLRARWLQELASRAAVELAGRFRRASLLPPEVDVARLSLPILTSLLGGQHLAPDAVDDDGRPTAPLPAAFRLTASGLPVPVRPPGRVGTAGTGAAEGRVVGRVHQLSEGPPDEGEILVVRVLDPSLAVALPRLTGLVSETGSTLSHLAILAREVHVPTVVGVDRALSRFRPGALVLVDGTTGEVSLMPSTEEAGP